MENKIQELTDKIYHEGVEKGNEEAKMLIHNAKDEAEKIIAEARKEADALKNEAQKKTIEMKDNTQAELKLFANQSLNALKTEITNLISDKIISSSIKEVLADKEFLNKFILTIAQQWTSDESIVISTADADSLNSFFTAKAKNLLDKGLKIEQVNGQKALFSIAPSNGAYNINFGEEEFENYFKSFLRPQLIEMLF